MSNHRLRKHSNHVEPLSERQDVRKKNDYHCICLPWAVALRIRVVYHIMAYGVLKPIACMQHLLCRT